MWPFKKKQEAQESTPPVVLKKLTPNEIYDLVRTGSASKGWLGFADDVLEAAAKKNSMTTVKG